MSPRKNTRPSPSPFGRPLRTMFLLTSMPIGGAETLLVNLVRRFDPQRIDPMVGCMKQRDVLGESLANDFPVFDNLIQHKYDFAVAGRLKRLFQEQQIDALVTVGAGDKMFWGRLGARRANVPVVLSALHSTGWPDGIGRLNRMLTRITDGFIAVARQHAQYQIEVERFPAGKVYLVPNGIDTDRFVFDAEARSNWRERYEIAPAAPVVGIVAALRPEKNHPLFLEAAGIVHRKLPEARFMIVGEGECQDALRRVTQEMGLNEVVKFVGATQDVPGVLSAMDVFGLSSHNEASPVSIMEALSCERPVVATDVGSIDESVLEGKTGFLVEPGDASQMADRWLKLLRRPELREQLGRQGREHVVENCSLESMTTGYTKLIEATYAVKTKSMLQPGSKIMPVKATLPDGWVDWEHQL